MFDGKEIRIKAREVNRARYAGPLICVQGFALDPKSITLNRSVTSSVCILDQSCVVRVKNGLERQD